MRSLFYVALLFCVPIWSAPIPADKAKPAVYGTGSYVGVRAKHLGEGKDSKNANIHPAVVVAGPNAQNKYQVATISKKLPHNPPQTPLQNVHSAANIYGNIQLGGSRQVKHEHMKPWKNPQSGQTHPPVPAPDMAKLKNQMAQHAHWKPPPAAAPPQKNTGPKHTAPVASGSRPVQKAARPASPKPPARPASPRPPQKARAQSPAPRRK